jgi:hypothetical protein
MTPELVDRLGERDIEDALAAGQSFAQELERQRRLARAREAFDQVQAIADEPAVEDVVEPGDAGRREILRRVRDRRVGVGVAPFRLGRLVVHRDYDACSRASSALGPAILSMQSSPALMRAPRGRVERHARQHHEPDRLGRPCLSARTTW